MSVIQKYYLKTYFLNAVLSGVIVALIFIYFGDLTNAVIYLVSYLIMGIFFTILTVNIHFNKIKSFGIQNITAEHLGVKQETCVLSYLEISEIKEKLNENHFFDQMTITDIENGVKIKTGLAWNFLDNRIQIVQSSNAIKPYEYRITSAPNMKYTRVDNGKNLKNVIEVAKLLSI